MQKTSPINSSLLNPQSVHLEEKTRQYAEKKSRIYFGLQAKKPQRPVQSEMVWPSQIRGNMGASY